MLCQRIAEESGVIASRRRVRDLVTFKDIRTALTHEDSGIRIKALHLLSIWHTTDARDAIASALLSDSCPIVRHEAAFFLTSFRDAAAMNSLAIAARTDAEELVRHEAAEALGELGLPDVGQLLGETSTDASALVRTTARIAAQNCAFAVLDDTGRDESADKRSK